MIYENDRKYEVLKDARKEYHIIDQWTYSSERILFMSEHEDILWFRMVKQGTITPDAQAG